VALPGSGRPERFEIRLPHSAPRREKFTAMM
jgi:hypothetical protein